MAAIIAGKIMSLSVEAKVGIAVAAGFAVANHQSPAPLALCPPDQGKSSF
jgi:hypothetical protein